MTESTQRRLAAIVSVDVVGYSRLMGADETGTLAMMRSHRTELWYPTIETFGGRVVGTAGDSILVEFTSAVAAVESSIAVQQGMATSNADLPDDKHMLLRIGINIGEVIVDGDDIYGDGVNVAARLQEIAEPGRIAISGKVQDEVAGKLEAAFADDGLHEVKNIAQPIHVWRWSPGDGVTPASAVAGPSLATLDKPSIAVLPFDNISGDPEQEYFVDGITEDIITGLAKFRQFFVISRNSTFTYKGSSVDVRAIAHDLGAQYVLEGSVRKSGNRVRITAQLIDANLDSHIWAERYDRDVEDMFRVQDEIAERIIASAGPEYLAAEMHRAQRKEARNLDAWDAYMRGYWYLLRYTEDDNTRAKVWLNKAIELDPVRAHYHSLLAVAYTMDHVYGWSDDPVETLRLAHASAEHGLAVDDRDSAVVRSLGIVHFYAREHEATRDHFERAVVLNPEDAETRALFGSALAVALDYDGAVEQIEYAIRLSPRDVHRATWYNFLAIAAVVVGRDETSVNWAKKAIQTNPQFPGGYRTLASSFSNLGRNDEASAAREKLQELLPGLTIAQLRARLPYFERSEDLERYLDGLRKAGLPE